MLPTRPDTATHERYVANILATWCAATPDQYARGSSWYRTAHQLAYAITDGRDVRMGAGVIAALSQQRRWAMNERMARDAFANGSPAGHYGHTLERARRIMSGEDPETVLPPGMKTYHFYRCILDPTDPDPVTVDRHAHDIVAGERYGEKHNRGLSNPKRYASIAHAYREAARRLGEIPQVVQAVTWIVQVEAYGGKRL